MTRLTLEQLEDLEQRICRQLRIMGNSVFRSIAQSTSWPYETLEFPSTECFSGGFYYRFGIFIPVRRIIGPSGNMRIKYHDYDWGSYRDVDLGQSGRGTAFRASIDATKVCYPFFVDYDDASDKLNSFYLDLSRQLELAKSGGV